LGCTAIGIFFGLPVQTRLLEGFFSPVKAAVRRPKPPSRGPKPFFPFSGDVQVGLSELGMKSLFFFGSADF